MAEKTGGDSSVSDRGKWQIRYVYRLLERDAFLDSLPDSDSYDGDTNVKGHQISLTRGLAKNVTLGLTYHHMKPIKTLSGVTDHSLGSGNYQKLLKTDLSVSF
ncbi:MAG TPA: hypothetical protein ENN78_01220 [Candidatus Omnitrophica bacterium]|nr:hypothetical protein [Candidatus Omnitrophota bacterium]